jgi:hypothetical protein
MLAHSVSHFSHRKNSGKNSVFLDNHNYQSDEQTDFACD